MRGREKLQYEVIEDFTGLLSGATEDLASDLGDNPSSSDAASDGKVDRECQWDLSRVRFGGRECRTIPEQQQRIAHLRDVAQVVNSEPMVAPIHCVVLVHATSQYGTSSHYEVVVPKRSGKPTLADWNPVHARVDALRRLGFARRLASTVERLFAGGLFVPSIASSSIIVNLVSGEFTPTLVGWEDAFMPPHPVPPVKADPWWAAPEIVSSPDESGATEAGMVFSLALQVARIFTGVVPMEGPKVGGMPAERILAGARLLDVVEASPDLKQLLPKAKAEPTPFSRELSKVLALGCAVNPNDRPTLLELKRALFPVVRHEKPRIRRFQIVSDPVSGSQQLRWHVEGADDVFISDLGAVGFRGEVPTDGIEQFELVANGPGGMLKARTKGKPRSTRDAAV